jgi:hypothetical protein
MAFWEEPGSECPVCDKKEIRIKHTYSHNGETLSEYLHHNGDGRVIVCYIGIPLSYLTRILEEPDYTEKERARRQKYWRRRQLPQQFINHRKVPLIGGNDQGKSKSRDNPVNDDGIKSITTTKPTDVTSIETTSGNRGTNNNEDPSHRLQK